MATIDQLYAEFVRAWQDGRAPELDDYVDRADPAVQDELIDRITTFVMVAPSVELRPERAAEIGSSPAFARALGIADGPDAVPWPARLRAARERAGLSLRDLGEAFAGAFGLAGLEDKAARVLEDLESGAVTPNGVTTRAADRLAGLLGLAPGALAAPGTQVLFRADTAPDGGPPAPAAAADFDLVFGMDADDVAATGGDGWDDVDTLLRGGDDEDD